MKRLYFIESIHTNTRVEEQLVEVNMTPVDDGEEEWIPEFFTFRTREFRLTSPEEGNIQEGQYVFYDDKAKENEPAFTDGTYTLVAQREIGRSIYLRAALLQRAETDRESIILKEDILRYDDAKVTSYHVNVGHGNCSLILIQREEEKHLWMVDCSVREMPNKSIHQWVCHKVELENTLDYIKSIVGFKDSEKPHIDHFMLTHMHYDHYNGLKYLIDQGYVDSKTVFYINLHYQWPSRHLNDIWQLMINKGFTAFIEPIHLNSCTCIHILHPECRIYKDKASILEMTLRYRFSSNSNNSSVVYAIKLAGKTMVFPGDLEQDGFDAMTKVRTCLNDWKHINFYAASHHCSFNGLTIPHCKSLIKCYNPLRCFRRNLKVTIIMGRDNAYNGIYSKYAENAYCQLSRVGVFKTDDVIIMPPFPIRSTTFVELEWNQEYAYNK